MRTHSDSIPGSILKFGLQDELSWSSGGNYLKEKLEALPAKDKAQKEID
jgi:hypothetical protein